MICPKCHSGSCRRSQRRSVKDYLVSLSGVRPWRCRTCGIRFFAWLVPVPYVIYAHCARCGNLDLQRVARDRVTEGQLARLQRALHIPAYRCDPCRRRFFSVRPFRRMPALRFEPGPSERSDS